MTTARCDNLVSRLTDWLADSFVVSEAGDTGCVINTPLLDRNRNALLFYVDHSSKDEVVLSDDGQTLNELEMAGLELDTERRKEIFNTVLRTHGIRLKDDRELTVVATEQDFHWKASELLQTMLELGGMADLTYSTVEALFVEDVGRFFEERKIPAVPGIQIRGESGLSQSFDYLVHASVDAPETLVKVVGAPSRQAFEHLMFSWTDIRDQRQPRSKAMAVINDRDEQPSPDYLSALRHYEIQPIGWSERDTIPKILDFNGR